MDNKKTIEYTLIVVSIIAAFFLFRYFSTQDARLCRSVLAGLVTGSVKVEKYIDWERLQATGFDVGAMYRQTSNPQKREAYRKLFIANFAKGFQAMRGDFNKFTNWRVLKREPTKVVVAADYLLYNKTILFTLSKLKGTKIIAIEWKQ